MNEVTIVCCYNNEKVYNDFVNTLKAQTFGYDLIGIDNTGNKNFTSCAAAYNSVIDNVKTKYVIYSHQDILLQGSDSLAEFISYLGRINHDDILGVAGERFSNPGTITNIMHRDNKTGKIIPAGMRLMESDMMECDIVDECFFGGYTEHFRTNPFNEALCNNWHFYAVEACLHTKVLKNHVYICDAKLLHMSSGSFSLAFHYGFYRLCRHYAKHFPFIVTTCTFSRTDFIHITSYLCHQVCGTFYHSGMAVLRDILKKLKLYDAIKRNLR